MLNRYSSNQHVDRGFTYHLASIAWTCQARRSNICVLCGFSNVSSSGSFSANMLCCVPTLSHSTLLFDLFLCARCVLIASVVVMYICIMVTAMSMHATIKGMAEVICTVVIVLLCGWACRGMLSTPMQGDSGGAHEAGGAGRSSENASRRAPVGRVPVVGAGFGAGPSRTHAGASRGGETSGTVSASESE